MDTIIHEQDAKIDILEGINKSQYEDFNQLLKIERDKGKIQSEIIQHTEAISNTYQEEKKELKKQVRKLKWHRAGLGALLLISIAISL